MSDFNLDALAALGRDMKPGRRRRVDHECGPGRSMLVSREPGRVRAWCFRCSEGCAVSLSLSIRENIQRAKLTASEDNHYNGGPMPEPLMPWNTWPAEARVWVLRAGINQRLAEQFRFGWHEMTRRVVFEIHGIDGMLRIWSARDLDGGRPKYITGHIPDGFVAGFQHVGPPVVVEDWLSAIRLHKAGIHVVCLVGTIPTDAAELYLSRQPEVITWLDPDPPGQDRASRLRRTLRARGVQVSNVRSLRDPKLHSETEIKKYVRFARAIIPSASASGGDSNE